MFRIAICDDEEEQLEIIRGMLERYMCLYLQDYEIEVFDHGEALLDSKKKFNVAFLDISMGRLNGIETGMKLRQKDSIVKIIYITSYEQFCNLAVNQVHAFAYLTKPIKESELIDQMNELVKSASHDDRMSLEFSNITEIMEQDKLEWQAKRIPISDIIFFEYLKAKRLIRIHTIDAIFECQEKLASLEEKMGVYGFDSCRRGLLVNFAYVSKINGDSICLSNGKTLPLSQKKASEFRNKLNEYILRGI